MTDAPTQAEGLDELERLAKAALALDLGDTGWFTASNFAKIAEPDDAAFMEATSPARVLSLIQQARDAHHWRDRALAAEGALRRFVTTAPEDRGVYAPNTYKGGFEAAQCWAAGIARAALTPEPDNGSRTEGEG